MSSEKRSLYVRKEILTALDQCGGYLVPEPTLYKQVRLLSAPPIMLSEFNSELNFSEQKGWVIGVRPDVGGPAKWKISDAGRAALAEM